MFLTDTDSKLEQLKQKYAAAFKIMEQQRISLTNVRLQDGKMFIQGAAHSQSAKNCVMEQFSTINPRWEQEVTCDLRTEEEQPPRPQTGHSLVNTGQDFSNQSQTDHRRYTVQAGDTLQTISHQFYGNDDDAARILEANRDKLQNADAIAEGQVLTIPA